MLYKRSLRGLLLAILMLSVQLAGAQQDFLRNLDACKEGAFSTEEDFWMQEGEPFDGNPYISDGDILSPNGQVCARNRELLQPRFDVEADLGLDGLDILDFERRLVAFSTELDSPFGTFTAGDLLITNGIIIPNQALVAPFQINHDVGLDELKFMGEMEAILEFIQFASDVSREEWLQQPLNRVLSRFNIDIWFSIEGTEWRRERPILDGDLLSVRSGVIATNRDLLHPAVPAGLPTDGVDFGLDAFSIPREALGSERPDILFSTELLYRGEVAFNDGDVLVRNGGIAIAHEDLIAAFNPAARFLGLDALWLEFMQPSGPRITHLCDIATIEFNGGTVPIGGPGTGLRESPLASPPATTDTYTQPCGRDVPLRGFLTTNPLDPVGDVARFRVAYREVSEPIPAAPGDPTTSAVTTSWTVYSPKLEWNGLSWQWECTNPVTLATTANGWMNAQDFMNARYGLGPFINSWIRCDHPELRLAVWNSDALPVGEIGADGNPTGFPRPGVQDREDHYVVWLEWEDTSSVMHREQADHHIQLDNTLPVIADYPDGLQVFLPDGTQVPACGETGPGADQLHVHGQFYDRFYRGFSLRLRGGLPPATAHYPGGGNLHYFYDVDDGTAGIKNTDDTGTVPDGSTEHLRDIFMTDLGASFTDCCYVLDLYVYDRAIRHTFDGEQVNVFTGTNYSNTFITFAATP
jgi:hypothetical protein